MIAAGGGCCGFAVTATPCDLENLDRSKCRPWTEPARWLRTLYFNHSIGAFPAPG